jgi:phenylpyruvate tautomerase PptA (4-oxalocrotonate tautomerase family)
MPFVNVKFIDGVFDAGQKREIVGRYGRNRRPAAAG